MDTNETPKITLGESDDAAPVLGRIVLADGVKIARIKKYSNGRWGYSPATGRSSGAIYRTRASALNAVAAIAR